MLGFDNDKYLKLQSEKILERISQFNNKLYLEFGGKLFDDLHASRVLPGFRPDSKIKLLSNLKEEVEIILVIGVDNIRSGKLRRDHGISYDKDLLRLLAVFQSSDLYVGSVVVSKYDNSFEANNFIHNIESLGIKVYKHYTIKGYPKNIDYIISPKGYGKNDYIETERPLVVVTSPGPGCGKIATCLSQLYHDSLKGIRSGYAKFETFPIWNLPVDHPINMAYEASTADLDDVNMIDHFHKAFYGIEAVNYNRDIDVYPILNLLLSMVLEKNPYNSPTDMGVNMVGYCISDQAVCIEASYKEIIRRYEIAENGTAEKRRLQQLVERIPERTMP